jgi:hypothetical protein
MSKAVWTGAIAVAAVLLVSGDAFAQSASANGNVNVNVNVNARAKLTITAPDPVDFPDDDPDVSPILTAAPFGIDVKARAASAANVTLTVSAPNLTGPGGTIGIAALRYAGTGAGFTALTPFSTTATSAGSWVGSGNRSGTHTYSLLNSWAYNVGAYGTSVTYTLTVP